jgi:hypothetical protein
MVRIKRLVLDVLKPHEPNSLEFAKAIAQRVENCRVNLTVSEMDDKTATTVIVVEGEDIRFQAIQDAVAQMGGSLHSIDEVEVAAYPDGSAD